MPLKQLEVKTLGELDPTIIEAIGRALATVGNDCLDRSGERKDRTVTLVMKFRPVVEQDGDCSTVQSSYTVKTKMPDRNSRSHVLAVRRNGFGFNPDSPDNPSQLTLLDEEDES